MAKTPAQTNGAEQTEQTSDKRQKLGFIPEAKLSAMVGAKSLADYRKAAEQMSAARETLTKLKADMATAIAAKLKLGDPATVDLSIQDDRAVLYRRPAERKRVVKQAMTDLTA